MLLPKLGTPARRMLLQHHGRRRLNPVSSAIQAHSWGSHSWGSLGASALPGHWAPSSRAGCVGARMRWQIILVASLQLWGRDPRQPPALLGPPCVSSWGCARSLDTLKVHRAINTRAQGCQRAPGREGLLKPNGLSLQLTLWVRDSPLCDLKRGIL